MKFDDRHRIAHGFPHQRMIVLPRPVVDDALRRPITSGVLPTDAGYFPTAASHYVDRRAGAGQAILIYCVSGAGWAEVGGRRVAVGEGSLLILPPGEPHRYGAADDRPWTIYWAHVAGASVPYLLDALEARPPSPVIPVAEPHAIVPLFERILATLGEAGHVRPSLLVAALAAGQLFGQLIDRRDEAADDVDTRLDATIEFMARSIRGTVRIAELAAMARLSPSHFAEVFKRKTGHAAVEYFIRLKMREACRLLSTTALPVNAIAARLGYGDPLYFSRAFHRAMGVAPRAYRSATSDAGASNPRG